MKEIERTVMQVAVLVRLKPLSKETGIPYSRLREWAISGRIPAFRTGGDKGTWLLDPEAVKEALKKMAA